MRIMKMKSSSLILVFSILFLVLSSCNIHIFELGWDPPFPEGYTGGLEIHPDSGMEPYVFETYDELMSAVDKLKSHGSTFSEGIILNCEENELDVKYIMILNAFKSDKIIKYGDDPFNRCVKDVDIINLIFFEDVSAEELSYSHLMKYDCYRLFKFCDQDYIGKAKNDPELVEYRTDSDDYSMSYNLYIDEIVLGGFKTYKNEYKDNCTELTEEYFKLIIDSIEFVGFDD